MDASERGEGVGAVGRLRSIIGGSIGNLIEWYDWYVYSAFSLYFSAAFFPPASQTAQLLNAAAVFAVGFLMRPIGGWWMGTYADRKGRRAALTLSVVLMSAGSLMVALAPTYARVGLLSPAILVFARLLQGFSVGGEYGASATYLSEISARGRSGFTSSFQYVTLICGQLTALAVLVFLQRVTPGERALAAWAWRLPFAIGSLGALCALYLRRGIGETDAFRRQRVGIGGSLRAYPREVATVVGMTLGGTVAFYTYSTYMQKYLTNTAGLTRGEATLATSGALLIFMLAQPAIGALSDRIGRRPVLVAFGVCGVLATVPLMTALGRVTSTREAFFLNLCALAVVSGYTSINAVVKAELFPTEIRARGVALPYAVTVSLFGGTAEYLALSCKAAGHEGWFFWYVTACIGVTLAVALVTPDSRDRSRLEPPFAGAA